MTTQTLTKLQIITCTLINILSYHLVFSAVPLSNCETDPCKYNMIDTNPQCFADGLCPSIMKPGAEFGVFPNSEERFQHQLKNVHRMHPNQTSYLPLTRLEFGIWGGPTYYDPRESVCGSTSSTRHPMYWYTSANQASRFKQWDEFQCDECYYDANNSVCWPWNDNYNADKRDECWQGPSGHYGCGGATAHDTCHWNDPTKYQAGSNCNIYMGDGSGDTTSRAFCGFDRRSELFGTEDSVLLKFEGICGGNSCYFDGHCIPVFLNSDDVQGNGFFPGMNGASCTFGRNLNPEPDYLLPGGAHYDERMRISSDDVNTDKPIAFILEYFDDLKQQKATECYVLYDSTYTLLLPYVSDDFTENHNTMDAYSLFMTHNFPAVTQCEPYSFLCKTTSNNYYRLPEDERYYFGTEWLDWAWSNYSSFGYGYECKENHYFNDGNDWIVDGGPTLTTDDIWYYQDTINYGECLGCNHIDVLVCWEDCIKSGFDETTCKLCNDQWTEPTRYPTLAPTAMPTSLPSSTPTNYPTEPTLSPTTQEPTPPTTQNPSKAPVIDNEITTSEIPHDGGDKAATKNILYSVFISLFISILAVLS